MFGNKTDNLRQVVNSSIDMSLNIIIHAYFLLCVLMCGVAHVNAVESEGHLIPWHYTGCWCGIHTWMSYNSSTHSQLLGQLSAPIIDHFDW